MADLQAVVFDYYETLVELSAGLRERVFDDLARRVGVDLPPGEAYRHWRELTAKDWELRLGGRRRPPLDGTPPPFVTFRQVWLERSRQLFAHWGVDAPAVWGAEAYRDAHAEATLYADARPALDALRGRYRLAVLSDADHDFIAASMARNRLAFETVVTSEQVRAYKPHVSLFRAVCYRLGVAPERALYVGDSPWADVVGARHASLQAVWLDRHGVAWPADIDPPAATLRSLAELAGRPEVLG